MSADLLEVELKFRVTHSEIRPRLEQAGATFSPPQTQLDLYFAHPSRNFKETDEALRIRSVADENCVTYKGPKLDRTTKTRREIEIPFAAGDEGRTQLQALLEALGFVAVREVRKRRTAGEWLVRGRTVQLALDSLAELGEFLELEIVTPPADAAAARETLEQLAAELQLGACERRGYLDLLLNGE